MKFNSTTLSDAMNAFERARKETDNLTRMIDEVVNARFKPIDVAWLVTPMSDLSLASERYQHAIERLHRHLSDDD